MVTTERLSCVRQSNAGEQQRPSSSRARLAADFGFHLSVCHPGSIDLLFPYVDSAFAYLLRAASDVHYLNENEVFRVDRLHPLPPKKRPAIIPRITKRSTSGNGSTESKQYDRLNANYMRTKIDRVLYA